MVVTQHKSALITGSNGGLGKELARQLGSRGDFDKIYLACRNEVKARAAQQDLETSTGRKIFEVIVMDMSNLESIRSAIPTIERPLYAVVMNAGGAGGPTRLRRTSGGVTEIFADNVLGHVVLLEQLLHQSALTDVAVLTSSEVACGIPRLRIPRPTFTNQSADEFATVIDGSFFGDSTPNAMVPYGQAKYLGALWMGALARKHADIRFITMSPGGTAGTQFFQHMRMPAPLLFLAEHALLPYIGPALGVAHKLEDGVGRLTQAVTDESLQSGAFYGSVAGKAAGPVIDQSTFIPDFRDPVIQDHAYEAIHRFIA